MLRSALMIAIAAFASSAMGVSAAEVQTAYKGIVMQANGPQASAFAAGQQISIRYVVETTTTDSNPNTSAGVFINGLRELRIAIPAAGVDVATGPGFVQTFNNVTSIPNSDQAFFYSYSATGQLAGLPVTGAEVDFVDYSSTMLASDAMPTTHLLTTQNSIGFTTSAGKTWVQFMAEPDVPATTCASEGYTGIQLIWCQNICEKDYTGTALKVWIRRWMDRYHDEPYCMREDAPPQGD